MEGLTGDSTRRLRGGYWQLTLTPAQMDPKVRLERDASDNVRDARSRRCQRFLHHFCPLILCLKSP